MADRAAMDLFEEHLAFVVPLRMAELASAHRRSGMAIRAIGDASIRRLQMQLGVTMPGAFDDAGRRVGPRRVPAADTTTAVLATMGDTLFGQSKPGRAELVAAAMATALAVAALTHPDGVSWRHMHWCATHCPPRVAGPIESIGSEWWTPLDQLLDELRAS